MEKYIYDEKTGISYTLQGDYYLPDIALSTEEQQPVGLWGQRHARYLKQHHMRNPTMMRYMGFLVKEDVVNKTVLLEWFMDHYKQDV